MPYIKKEERAKFKGALESIRFIQNAGNLNYIITCACQLYLFEKGESYQTHNDIRGALENCASEWYRRKVVNLEEKKIKENGDVY